MQYWAPGVSEWEKKCAVHVFMCSGVWPTGTTVEEEE